jgi:hypothetical protein
MATTESAGALDRVHIALVGDIEQKCGLSGSTASVQLGDVTTHNHRDLTLGLSCNTPFQYTVQSANGGLRHAGPVNRIGPFIDLLPYRVNVVVPTDRGNAVFSCDSDGMTKAARRCAPADSGDGIAVSETVSLSLSWQSPRLPMLAGRFEDALTISLSIKP